MKLLCSDVNNGIPGPSVPVSTGSRTIDEVLQIPDKFKRKTTTKFKKTVSGCVNSPEIIIEYNADAERQKKEEEEQAKKKKDKAEAQANKKKKKEEEEKLKEALPSSTLKRKKTKKRKKKKKKNGEQQIKTPQNAHEEDLQKKAY